MECCFPFHNKNLDTYDFKTVYENYLFKNNNWDIRVFEEIGMWEEDGNRAGFNVENFKNKFKTFNGTKHLVSPDGWTKPAE